MNYDDCFLAGIPAREIRMLFTEAALRAGVIQVAEEIEEIHIDFALEIVAMCARLVDRYPNPECTEDTIGDVIRGQLFEA